MSIISAISAKHHGWSSLHLFVDKAVSLNSLFSDFWCSHVGRGGHSVAHHVARWDVECGLRKMCFPLFSLMCCFIWFQLSRLCSRCISKKKGKHIYLWLLIIILLVLNFYLTKRESISLSDFLLQKDKLFQLSTKIFFTILTILPKWNRKFNIPKSL